MLGIDGLPFSFLNERMRAGKFPNFQQLLVDGDMARMDSSLPPVSSVAWTSIMTGRNPAGHNIFGFVDRTLNPFETFIPTAANRRAKTIWDILGEAGRYCVVMNVPCTYPPSPINGKLISCFLSSSIEKATWPPQLALTLKRFGYIIDPDPWKARRDPPAFLDDLFTSLERRLEVTMHLMDTEPWDFFATHIMETDRLFHFYLGPWQDGHPEFAQRFDDFLDKVDSFVGEIKSRMPDGAHLVILSDHGFCRIKKEVQINYALHEAGLLKFTVSEPKELAHIAPETIAYSLIPGRVFINLKGREPMGRVEPGADYEKARRDVAETLLSLRDPGGGAPMIEKVLMKEEIYSGDCAASAPDLVAMPFDGYDLKGALKRDSLTGLSEISGMHTFNDALLYASGQVIGADGGGLSLVDVLPSVLSLFGIAPPASLDGKNRF